MKRCSTHILFFFNNNAVSQSRVTFNLKRQHVNRVKCACTPKFILSQLFISVICIFKNMDEFDDIVLDDYAFDTNEPSNELPEQPTEAVPNPEDPKKVVKIKFDENL